MRRRPGAAVLVAAGYLVLAVVTTWPLARRAGDHLVAIAPADGAAIAAWGEADHLLNLWILGWGYHALGTAPARLFDANVFHPLPEALATGEHMLGAQPWFAPAYAATGNPIAGANALVFLSFVLGGLGTYWLIVAATGRRVAGAVAGVVFAFAPWRYFWLVHLQLVGVHVLPFILLALHRALTGGRARWVAAFALALGLQALTSYYVAYMCALFGGAVLAYWPGRAAAAGARSRWLATIGAGAAAALAVGLASLPYVRQAGAGVVPSGAGAQDAGWLVVASVRPANLLASEGLGLGWAALALAVVGLVPWRGAGRLQAAALWIGGAGIVLALGPTCDGLRLPWAWLAAWVPGFSTLRVPGRFLIVATLGVAVLAGFGAARLEDGLARRVPRALAAAVPLVFVLACYVPYRLVHGVRRVPMLAEAPAVHRWLAEHGDGGPVLVLPMGTPLVGAELEARAEYFGILHWLPLLNGYNGYQPAFHEVYAELAARLPEPEAFQTLVNLVDVRWLVVNHGPDPSARARWATPPAGLEPAVRFDDGSVFAVTRAPTADWRAHLRSRAPETTTFSGLPIVPVAETARRVALAADVPPHAIATRPLGVRVRVENRGDARWPAFAVRTDGPVRLWWRWRDGAGRVGAPEASARILADLAPGEATAVQLFAWVPPAAGRWTLEFAVGQGAPDDPGAWRTAWEPFAVEASRAP
jgi:hypothetical protein